MEKKTNEQQTPTATEQAQALVKVQELTKTIEELKSNIEDLKSNNQDLLKANSILSSRVITGEMSANGGSEGKTDINEISRKEIDKKVADMLIAHTTGKRDVERKLSQELEQIAKDIQHNKSTIIED